MSKLLQAQGLGKRFGGLQALSDVSFDIEQGEIYGLIGPNAMIEWAHGGSSGVGVRTL